MRHGMVLFITLAILLISQGYARGTASCPKECKCVNHISSVIMRCTTLHVDNQSEIPVSYFEIAHSDQPIAIHENAFARLGLKGVNSISITNISVSDLNNNAFKELRELTDVKISNTNISKLHPDIFQHNEKLKKLNLTNNPLTGINYFIKSASVEELDMSSCNLTKIGPNTFQNLSGLTLLDLRSNNIKKLLPGTFDYLTDISEIRLANNLISELPKNIFAKNTELENLYLDNNPLTTFSGEYLSNLIVLSLSSCKLEKIPEGLFDELEDLDLSNNKLTKIGSKGFHEMPSLTNINLSGNNLQHLDESVFANNPMLEKIILDNNHQLLKLPETGFTNDQNSFNVYWFSCKNCGLKSLPEKTFDSMPAIVTLKLSHNNIEDIRTEVFKNLNSLTDLDLSHNQISTIDDNTFKNNINLYTLYLNGNPLKTLHPSIFQHNLHLQNLDVSNCGLFELWTSPKSTKLSSIQNLNISNNRIDLITIEDVSVTDKLKSIDISGNHIKCSDSYKSLVEYLINNEIQDNHYITHEKMAYDFEVLAKDMVQWKEEAKKQCPNINFEIVRNIDENNDDVDSDRKETFDSNLQLSDGNNNDSSNDDDDEEDDDDDDYDDEDDYVTDNSKNNRGGMVWQEHDVEGDEPFILPTRSFRNYPYLWPVLVFIGTALAILGIVANAILFVIRRRQRIQVPRIINIRSMSKLKKNSGLVYQQLSEERDGVKTPVLGRFVAMPSVHQHPNAPEHV